MTQDLHTPDKESLMEFPCDYELKAIGANTDDLVATVIAITQQYAPDAHQDNTRTSLSKTGKWKTVNVRFQATSLDQLHAIYGELKQHPAIQMTL